MIIFPAIDIKNGSVVRLSQGKFDEVTEYSHDPLTIAAQFKGQGAQWIHIVDLDGAQTGKIRNLDIIANITRSVNVRVQMGGGVRSKQDIARLFEAGVSRVILGTRAIEDRAFLEEILLLCKDKLAVSLDCSNGYLMQKGWTAKTDIKAINFVKELEYLGVSCIVYTDIACDGMLTGPNLESLDELLEVTNIPVIASGGISNLKDIEHIAARRDKGIAGVITGKAIYEGRLNLRDAIKGFQC